MSAAPTTALGAPAPAEIDASCRVPLLVLYCCAALWLIAASLFGLVVSIKFHAPGFLANPAWLTYGRLYPASTNALIYGFALPAGFATALWILCRLGRAKLAAPGVIVVAALLWNFGVKLGLWSILQGETTGFDLLEMPRHVSPILFTAYTLIGVCGLLTFQRRAQDELYPSQWFLLAALFWFPWIYSTANLLLVFAPVRGVAQAVIAWWFANNLQTIVLGFLGLGAIFYFIPKLTGRPLHSLYLALFAFWTLALFGSWIGVPPGAPLPAWLPGVSTACAVLTLVPILAVTVNLRRTFAGGSARIWSDTPLGFVTAGFVAWLLWGITVAATSIPQVSNVTHFTWLERAQSQLGLYGFFALTMFGAIYHIVPRLVPDIALCPKLMRAHFWCGLGGILLLVLPLAIGGVLQSLALRRTDVAFTDAMKVTLPFLRISTMGELFIAAGNVLLAVNLASRLAGFCRACCLPAWRTLSTERPGTAEVMP